MITRGPGLGILAGGGGMPIAVAQAAKRDGRCVHIVAIRGEADQVIEAFPHTWVTWGEVGRILKTLNNKGCRELVIIGSVKRPDLNKIRLDLGAFWNLPRLIGITIGGDDSVLGSVVRFLESKGFTVRGAHEIASELVIQDGVAGCHKPNHGDALDIEKAFDVVDSLGVHDIGQAAVVAGGHVLAVEAAEGTDEMLKRCANLSQWGRGRAKKRVGVLVKSPKPNQELRVDMPTVGPRTIELAANAGLAGVALKGGNVLIAERENTVRLADDMGLFIVAIPGQAVSQMKTERSVLSDVPTEGRRC